MGGRCGTALHLLLLPLLADRAYDGAAAEGGTTRDVSIRLTGDEPDGGVACAKAAGAAAVARGARCSWGGSRSDRSVDAPADATSRAADV